MTSSAEPSSAAVIGFGSIGRRHADILAADGWTVHVVSRRSGPAEAAGYTRFAGVAALLAERHPDYIVVANETTAHLATLGELASRDYQGRVLVEKPLFDTPADLPTHSFAALGVGYNLRFHPAVQAARQALGDRPALCVQASVGQYLPDWRPDTDYRKTESAKRARGGGVLRDLSHEIDLLHWLFGPPERLCALGGRVSTLEIDTDDAWSVLMRQPASRMTSLHLDYLHRPVQRQMTVVTEDRTVELDLVAGRVTVDGESETHPAQRNDSYTAMHRAMLAGTGRDVCGPRDAQDIVRTIAGIETSAHRRQWIAP